MLLVNNIKKSVDEIGSIDLCGINLESADPKLLDVTYGDLNLHVAMQPAAIAYYGTLLKDSARRVNEAKRQFERWSKKKYLEAKASLVAGSSKATVQDIEVRFTVDNEKELEEWDKLLDRLQEEYDTLNMWYEAWKQKSYSIQQQSSITEAERYVKDSLGGTTSKDRIRELIDARKNPTV